MVLAAASCWPRAIGDLVGTKTKGRLEVQCITVPAAANARSRWIFGSLLALLPGLKIFRLVIYAGKGVVKTFSLEFCRSRRVQISEILRS